MKARLVTTETVAAETAGFTFETQAPFAFVAGQTCDLTIASPRYTDEKGSSRTFSIASSPLDTPRILFATRLTGSAFKRTLLEARSGLEIEVEGPGGSFVLHKNTARPAVFFAGGIGITPFRSMIKDATERHLPHRIVLFYSNRSPRSTAFLSDLEAWQKANVNFRLIATITDPSTTEPWAHARGMMTTAFVKPYLQATAHAIYYLAGPPAFVTAVAAALAELGVDPDDVRSEEFAGY